MFPLACLTWDAGEMAERGIRQSGAEGLDLHLSAEPEGTPSGSRPSRLGSRVPLWTPWKVFATRHGGRGDARASALPSRWHAGAGTRGPPGRAGAGRGEPA